MIFAPHSGVIHTSETLNSCPDSDFSRLKLNALRLLPLLQRLIADFWKRWKSKYSNTSRAKWHEPSVEIKINTILVLIKDE